MIRRIVTGFTKLVIASVIGIMSFIGITANPDEIIQGLPYRFISNEHVQQIEKDAYREGYSEGISSTNNNVNNVSVVHSNSTSVLSSEFPKAMYVTEKDGLFLRTGPGTGNDAIYILNYGQNLWIERVENGWAYTTIDGYSGFCSTEYLAEINEYKIDYSNANTSNEHMIVYYTRYGECYHIDSNCTSLRRSNVIYDGDVNEICQNRRPCKLCMPYEYGD